MAIRNVSSSLHADHAYAPGHDLVCRESGNPGVEVMERLLTTREAAKILRMDRKKFASLGLPYVLLGRRKKRYRPEDLTNAIEVRMVFPRKENTNDGRKFQPRKKAMGFSRHPTWEEAKKLSLAHQGSGAGGL